MSLCSVTYVILFIIYFWQIVNTKMIYLLRNFWYSPKIRDLKVKQSKATETIKGGVVVGGWVGRGVDGGAAKPLWVMRWPCSPVQARSGHTTERSPQESYRLWVTPLCRCRLIKGNQCPTLVGASMMGDHAWVGAGAHGKCLYLPSILLGT